MDAKYKEAGKTLFEELMDFDCACGKHHALTTRIYEVSKDAMGTLPGVLEKLGAKKPLAVFDSNTYRAAGDKLQEALPSVDLLLLEGEHIRADEEQLAAIQGALEDHDVLLAVGSGVICDLVRYTAFQEHLLFVAVPTAASVDGYVSNSAAMTLRGAKITLPAKAPDAVVADLEIIAAAPKRLTASGVGDMLSKYISIADWKVGALSAGEYYCDKIANLELEALDIIVSQIDDIAAGSIEAMGSLVKGLLLSGIAMQLSGITRPASSFEHHFSHYLETVPVGGEIDVDALHGEKVGVATRYAAKYYPIFARSLARIFEEDLPDAFSMEKVKELYKEYPPATLEWVEKENTPTTTLQLNKELLKRNFDKILEVAASVPSEQEIVRVLDAVGAKDSYKDLRMTGAEFRRTMEICCYIRNRYTMLRLVCDYNLFDFSTMDD